MMHPTVSRADVKRHMSPITPADRGMYESVFARAPGAAVYANSWAYITQACRGIGQGLGLKYARPGALYAIGRHRGHYVVVNPLGELKHLSDLVTELRRASSRPVFLKKIHPAKTAGSGLMLGKAAYFAGRQPAPGEYV